jgi:hypothetical protein
MVKVECITNHKLTSILIDLDASLGYISPDIVEGCKLYEIKHKRSWLVKLATRMKRKVVELVKHCIIVMY